MLNKLKQLIDELNYPYFTDDYLTNRIGSLSTDNEINNLALELMIVKSGIEEIKLGDITIKSPSAYFTMLAGNMRNQIDSAAFKNRNSSTRRLVRADGRK